VIPEFDRDPVHSTTRFRETAQPKWPAFNGPVPDVSVSVLPSNAMVPLS